MLLFGDQALLEGEVPSRPEPEQGWPLDPQPRQHGAHKHVEMERCHQCGRLIQAFYLTTSGFFNAFMVTSVLTYLVSDGSLSLGAKKLEVYFQTLI